jgi:YidC/Oxa1 family membrane protein insertase
MYKNVINFCIFLALATSVLLLLRQADKNLPKPENKDDPAAKVDPPTGDGKDAKDAKDAKGEPKKDDKAKPPEPPKLVPPPPPPEPPTLVQLGEDGYYNRALLTTRSGGIQQVVLPKFDQADRIGREVKAGDGTAVPYHIIPGIPQPRAKVLNVPYEVPALKPGKVPEGTALTEPSYATFHYPTPEDKYPDPRLGETNWKVVSEERPAGGVHKVVFETELGDPYFVKLRKIYTLGPKDYHIGLRMEVEGLPGRAKGKGLLRYQLAGPHGLFIEGEWYTQTYRVSVIGSTDAKGAPRRQYEDAATIGRLSGADEVKNKDLTLKYMAVATQYFTSAVAVDDRSAAEGAKEQPWAWARATTEIPLGTKPNANAPFFDDITVRAASEALDLAPGEKVAHSYVIYNGPSKVRLLDLLDGEDRAVPRETVDRYRTALHLQTITDFHSPTKIGRFADYIYWTDIVVVFTNLMHGLLAAIHTVVPSWALSVVVLTMFVRLLLFYPSRKQTAMSMRMMEVQKRLQPEFAKLQEKYKGDMGAYQREKTRLMMANGANPFAAMGGCLLLFAQMPVMMGLYFALQESVFFRLDSFLWINNLAAPDMTGWWSEKLPFLSTPEDIGSLLYLGPYFNLLPILAVGLMLYQQAKMMPASGDPQADQQRMMMKLMMIMMAVFFYKVAAGLALYFIVSTSWAIIERQLIPKPKIDTPGEAKAVETTADGKPADPVVAAQQKSKGLLGRLKEAMQKRLEEARRQADEMSKRQIKNNQRGDDRDADKGGGGNNGDGGNNGRDRRDRKKKRRK